MGDLVASVRTLVVGVREYTAYVWGQRVPRTNEARARAAYNDLQEEVARMGDPSPLLLHERFLTEVRVALAAVAAGQLAKGKAEAWFLDQVKTSLEAHDAMLPNYRPRGAEYMKFLNNVACSLVEGLSPLTADLMNMEEMSGLLHELHYPGFWTDESAEGKVTTPPAETTTETSPTGSTSKPKSPASSDTAGVSSEQ